MPTTTITFTRSLSWEVRAGLTITRSLSWAVRGYLSFSRQLEWSVVPPWSVTNTCTDNVIPGSSLVFRRLLVSYMINGGTRVAFEMDRHFCDPAPHAFVLQSSQSGVDTGDDWVDVASGTDVFFLDDASKREYGKTSTLHYRLRLTTSLSTYTSPVANTLGRADPHGFLLCREVLRKEQLRHRIFGSVPGYLLKARRYGTPCSCLDQYTGLVKNADHADCYGTGFISGYYPAVVCSYSDMTPESSREMLRIEGAGTERGLVVRGRFIGIPLLAARDVFVNSGSDERYLVHSVKELSTWRSIPLVLEAELRLLPYSSILYSVPLT